jgi:hypothetical protein
MLRKVPLGGPADDSSPANQEKYYSLLEQTKTHNELYYVGPREKDQLLAYLNGRLRDKRLEGWSRTCSGPATAAIATTRSCTRWVA